MPTRSDDIWPLAHRVLWLQALAGVAAVLVALAFWGRNVGISALAGALTGVIANLYMTVWALRPARTARVALRRLYFGQAVKVALTVALFLGAAHLPHLSWPALLLGYVATLVVFWFVPFASAARAKGRIADGHREP